MNENTEVIQLSAHNIVITFNKHAIEAIKGGSSQAVKVKQRVGKDLTFLFMRDTEYRKQMANFQQQAGAFKRSWLKRLWPFGKKVNVGVRESGNRKFKDVNK